MIKTKTIQPLIYILLFIGSFFAATQTLPPNFEFVSTWASVVLALPSFVALIQLFGRKKGVLIILLLGLFALFIENFAILTGFPYGNFYYLNQLGFKIGAVPWTVAFTWTPLLFGCLGFARLLLKKYKPLNIFAFVLLTCFLMVTTDLVLDPGAVALDFWRWQSPGFYYGVPLINFFGWIVSSLLGTLLFLFLENTFLYRKISLTLLNSWKYSLVFWIGVSLWEQLWIPFVLGICFLSVITLKIHHHIVD